MFKFRIHPLFIALAIISIFFSKFGTFLLCLVSVLVHEYAHFLIAKHYGYLMSSLTLMPYGAILYGNEQINKADNIKIAIAGPLVNLFLAFLTISLWWIFPITYSYTDDFVIINLSIGIFNIFPAFPLDGSRIFLSLFNKNRALKFVKVFGVILALALMFFFILSAFSQINFTYGIMSIFLMTGAISSTEKARYMSVAEVNPYNKKLSQGLKKNTVMIPYNIQLFKILKYIKNDTFNDFIIVDKNYKEIKRISENLMVDIFINNDLKDELQDVLK